MDEYVSNRKLRWKMMPQRKKIIEHWNQYRDLLGNTKYGDLKLDDSCFACGDILRLERIHIEDFAVTKDDSLNNLNVLCARCHVESEHYTREGYFNWIRYKRMNEYLDGEDHYYKRLEMSGLLSWASSLNDEEASKWTPETGFEKFFDVKIKRNENRNQT